MPRGSNTTFQDRLEEQDRKAADAAKEQRARIFRNLVVVLQKRYPEETCDGCLRAARVIMHAAKARMQRDPSYRSLLTAARDELKEFRQMLELDPQDRSEVFGTEPMPPPQPIVAAQPHSAPAK
jgi:hypothetical protein